MSNVEVLSRTDQLVLLLNLSSGGPGVVERESDESVISSEGSCR